MSELIIDKITTRDGSNVGAVVVADIDELLLLNTNKEINTTAIVKDSNRGGVFNYDATQSGVNNGGTIFNGWTRDYSGAVQASWFGAVDNSSGSENIDMDITLAHDEYIFITPKYNSYGQMTLNNTPIKILDINATEESQWTHSGYNSATRNKTKVPTYRLVSQNMISADVEYKFRYDSSGFYEVYIDKIYKHVFLACGSGQEITELADAINFASQFSLAKYIDPLFQNMNSATENYPNKAQISIGISSSTISPVTSVMNKAVRIGENNMNGIEIVNAGRYNGNTDPDTCIIDFSGVTLGADDLACLNIWKTDLGEIHGITFKYHGDFSISNQSVIRYNRTEGRFKACIIDVEGCTFTGMPGGVTALYADNITAIR